MVTAPLTISFHIGEEETEQYILVTSYITGGERQFTATQFRATGGPFVPATNIQLNPDNRSYDQKIELVSGKQRLVINHLTLTLPTESTPGKLDLDCGYSDYYGNEGPKFMGTIASWPIKDSIPVPCLSDP